MEALSVFPVSAALYSVDERFTHTVVRSDNPRRPLVKPDRASYFARNLRHGVRFGMALRPAVSAALCSHIGKILCLRSKPEMVRAHTSPIVARVADYKPSGDRAGLPFEGEPMRRVTITTAVEDTVPVPFAGARPQPTLSRHVDILVEVCGGIPNRFCNNDRVATKPAHCANTFPPSPWVKGLQTNTAGECDVCIPLAGHAGLGITKSPRAQVQGARLCGWRK